MTPVAIASALTEGFPLAADDATQAAQGFRRAAHGFRTGDFDMAREGCAAAESAARRLVARTAPIRAGLLERAAAEHARVLGGELPRMAKDALIYDDYFGLTRVERATASEQAAAAAETLTALAHVLGDAPLSLDDHATLAAFAAEVLAVGGSAEAGGTTAPPLRGGLVHRGWIDPVARWRLGHAVYGLANRAAAQQVTAATRALHRDADRAAALLRRAAHSVAALTAAMELAAAISSHEYLTIVRPTMRPPQLDIELTGFQNADHTAWRTAIDHLLTASEEPFATLAARHRELAEARDALLHADLIDLERHITLTYRLVGHLPALDENPAGSAVQELRARLRRRSDLYGPLMRHGWITGHNPKRTQRRRRAS